MGVTVTITCNNLIVLRGRIPPPPPCAASGRPVLGPGRLAAPAIGPDRPADRPSAAGKWRGRARERVHCVGCRLRQDVPWPPARCREAGGSASSEAKPWLKQSPLMANARGVAQTRKRLPIRAVVR